ncbi:hypothetical protein ACWD4G_12000 [Streptomyces sp. NPDC002643]
MTAGNQGTPGDPENHGIQAFGVDIHGVGINHGQVNLYVPPENAPPEKKIEAARANLLAGMRERAEQLIDDAIDDMNASGDTPSPEAMYYRVLSLVSRRAPEDLTDEAWHKLRHALDRLVHDPGEYGEVGRVLRDLLRAAVGTRQVPDPGGRPDPGTLLESLDEDHRDDVKDHLRYVIQNIERDALDRDEESELDQRLAKKREERAPLFFTPDPVLHSPLPPEEPTVDAGGVVVLCFLGVLAGVAMLFAQIPDDLLADDWSAAFFTASLGAVALAFGLPPWLRAMVRSARRADWLADPDVNSLTEQEKNPFRTRGARLGAALTNRKQWREERERRAKERQRTKKAMFRRTVETIVQNRFLEYEPKGSDAAKMWRRHTERPRQDLIDELTHRHWRTATPGALDWLIQLRAKEIGGRAVDSAQIRLEEQLRRIRRLGAVIGIVLLVFAATRLIPARAPDMGGWALIVIAVSLVIGAPSALHLGKMRAFKRERQQYDTDQLELQEWALELKRSRPSDEQMARWYDLDQLYLRREVLAEHRMEHRDILFSFFLVEGVPGCVRAKVTNGPPRYSQYHQTFYVLTSSGVWVSSWNVDFATGEHDGRQDQVFRYDAISSVTVESVGVRFGDSLREIVSVSEEGARRGADDEDELVLHEAMRLVLHNGQRMTALLENYEQLYDSNKEDRGQLRLVALETSGITAGFRILTAMATEGRKWFEQRRQRSYQLFVEER